MSRPTPDSAIEFAQRPLFFAAGGAVILLMALVFAVLFAATLASEGSPATLALGFVFGLGTILLFKVASASLWRASWGPTVVMRVCPEGLWHRQSTKAKTLPWTSIQDVTFHGGKGGGMKVLLDQQTFDTLFKSSLSRLAYQLNWAERRPMLAIHVGGLAKRPREIFELTAHYAAAYRGV